MSTKTLSRPALLDALTAARPYAESLVYDGCIVPWSLPSSEDDSTVTAV